MKPPFGQPVLTDNIMQPVPNSSVIVIHPGSRNLRIGRASDLNPVTLPHCIARRHRSPGRFERFEQGWLLRTEAQHGESRQQQKAGLKQGDAMLQERPLSSGNTRIPVPVKQVAAYNSGCQAEVTEVRSPAEWTNLDYQPEYVIGDEALMIRPNAPYDLHWPYRGGDVNVHWERGGSLTAIIPDLQAIWTAAIQSFLAIDPKSLQNYRAVLLIPDMFNRRHVADLASLLTQRMGFSAVIVHQESVCALYGAGLYQGCVVDVGDHKTAVSCVDEGLSDPNTRMRLSVGGRDITRCFYSLLCRSGFPYKKCSLASRTDSLFLDELKQQYCHLDTDVTGTADTHVQLKAPGKNIIKYRVRMGDERLLAPLCLFCTDLLALKGPGLVRVHEDQPSLPDDPCDDDYLARTQSRQEQSARMIAEKKKKKEEKEEKKEKEKAGGETAADSDATEGGDVTIEREESFAQLSVLDAESTRSSPRVPEAVTPNPTSAAAESDWENLALGGLDKLIAASIERVGSDEAKAKMYSTVLVVGGGLKFEGASSWLTYLLNKQMPPSLRPLVETIDVCTKPKDLEPETLAWKGGAVLPCLESAQELWVSGPELAKFGPRVIREKAPFAW